METLSCRVCGAQLSAEDIDRRLGIVSCSHCGGIFDLTRRRNPAAPADTAPEPREKDQPKARAHAALPEKYRVERGNKSLTVSWRWFTMAAVFLLFFAIAWDAFLIFWYAIAFSDGAPEGPFGWLMIVFPFAHLAVGVGITYFVIASFVNTTTIHVDRNTLSVRHRPMPWLRSPTFSSQDIEQLFVVRKTSTSDSGTSHAFELHVVTRDNRKVKLLGGLKDLGQGLWLEQEIEEVLEIRDRAVSGEFRDDSVHS